MKEYLDELGFPCTHCRAKPRKVHTKIGISQPAHLYVGKGKFEEIQTHILKKTNQAPVIFDDEPSPKQVANIEREKVKILDRTSLILDIFPQNVRRPLQHARSGTRAQYLYSASKHHKHVDSTSNASAAGIGMRARANPYRLKPTGE